MKKFIAYTSVFLIYLSMMGPVYAASFTDTLKDFGQNINTESKAVSEEINKNKSDGESDAQAITLPTYQDSTEANAYGEGGLRGITAALFTFLDFFKLIVTPVTILFMVVMGVRMVAAGRDNSEVETASKNYIRYAMEGLIVIFISDAIVRSVAFGIEGDIFRGGEAGAADYGRQASSFLRGIYSLIEVVIGSIAVFELVTAGMRYIAASASDDQITTAKRQIQWSLVGLFIVGIAEFMAKNILFKEQGTSLGISNAKSLIVQITNFVAGTIGTLSFVFLLYAGFLYVTAAGKEDNVSKAKKILMGAAIGVILAISAFAITSTIVPLDSSR
ncbi:hypothetical protein HY463_01695 [Candidatus Peregrinibacteria bacterium]|nr:hypothetical protein [Candidatus Peregrinibacteria bacterium]